MSRSEFRVPSSGRVAQMVSAAIWFDPRQQRVISATQSRAKSRSAPRIPLFWSPLREIGSARLDRRVAGSWRGPKGFGNTPGSEAGSVLVCPGAPDEPFRPGFPGSEGQGACVPLVVNPEEPRDRAVVLTLHRGSRRLFPARSRGRAQNRAALPGARGALL